LIWHFPNKWIPGDGPGINYSSAIRRGDWKLVYNMRSGNKELYNLQQDPQELIDLAKQNPALVKELSSLLSQQLRKWQSPMPLVKQTGLPVPMPDEQ